MKPTRSFNIIRSVFFSLSVMVIFMTVSLPSAAFNCPPVFSVRLQPVNPATGPKLAGYAEINECLGMSFVHIVVRGRLADETPLIPAIVGVEPILGDWFTMTNHRAETVMQGLTSFGVPAGGLTGRTITIEDIDFTPLLTGTF